MENYKEILKSDWDFYVHAIEKYNSDEVAEEMIEAKSKEDLIAKVKELVRSNYEEICPDDVDTNDDRALEEYVNTIIEFEEGDGFYDILGYVTADFAIMRIDSILERNLFDINLQEVIQPGLIEERYKGKVYAVYSGKLRFIVVDDSDSKNCGNLDVFAVLRDAGIRLEDYFMWDTFRREWNGHVVDIKGEDIYETFDFLHDCEYEQPEIFYVSEVWG